MTISVIVLICVISIIFGVLSYQRANHEFIMHKMEFEKNIEDSEAHKLSKQVEDLKQKVDAISLKVSFR